MKPLSLWMIVLLRFAGVFNLLAGTGMGVFYHEGFRMLGVAKPGLVLPVQVMGILVALFGVGYLLVAANPVENRNILLLGFWSKAISASVAMWYVAPWAADPLPWWFAVVVFFSDVIYLPPFYVILRRLNRLARG
jgi:hypothetical protein